MQENKVIFSNITRDHKPLQNNLYDLISVKPANPTPSRDVKEHTCNFQPVTGKTYMPKKRIRFSKVNTVRDIRNLFENDISIDLSKDLEKQQKLLLKKITCGSSREENTKEIARNMLKCEKPVSRSAWQMLMNVNPEGHQHAFQYVLWNGKRIRVNGSKGGKYRFICNYDLANLKLPVKKENKRKLFSLKKGLLQSSLAIKFKPGPLSKKRFLDDSFQKYNVGKTELVDLPKPGLDIQPAYGVALEPMIANFVQNLRDNNGTISETWAEFATSVVGTVKNQEAIQDCNENGVTFELKYKRNQQRMLLRKGVDKTFKNTDSETPKLCLHLNDESATTSEVENIVKEMLDSVEISLQQDFMYTGEDEPREHTYEETVNVQNATKDKGKRRCGELSKLDVTVIRLPDVAEDDTSKTCTNAHCSLGCICASLHRPYHIRQHCGRIDCMFECKCDFTKYKITDTLDTDCPELIPGLINLDNKLNSNMAKEEQKFHQTVVLTGEKSILLKSERRNWKATKKYGDFYESMCLKNEIKCHRMLSIVAVKLNCENIQPWCMVHNLYKCFCKGKFTQKANIKSVDENDVSKTKSLEEEVASENVDIRDKKQNRSERNSAERNDKKRSVSEYSETIDLDSAISCDYTTCARIRPYKARKYFDEYYQKTNQRIIEMEKNDNHLRKRMLTILNKAEDSDTSISNQSANINLQSVHEISQFQDNPESNDENSLLGNDTEAIKTTSTKESINNDQHDSNDSVVFGPKLRNSTEAIRTTSTTESINSDKHDSNDSIVFRPKSKDETNPDRSILNTTSNKAKLIAWLESSYKQYKQRIEQGIVKKSLDPPRHGKVALYPWEFILSRYRERKNLFLISMEKPFRIFMAVDAKNNFFNNCINIDDIRFADLHKYPVTVKNLLTNATELKDNFCILCGLSLCWELIGSVTKLDDQSGDTDQLRSVSDDKKIGFIAQDKEQCSNTGKLSNPEGKMDNNFAFKKCEDLENPSELADQSTNNKSSSEVNKKGIRRKRKINKRKKTTSKKIKASINNDHSNERECTQERNDDSNIDEPKGSCNSKASSVSCDQDQGDSTELPNLSSKSENELHSERALNIKDLFVQEMPVTRNETELDSQSSKWFVMTVENDFSEIQFYTRGFFVKYESIIKAINVARMSGKTVRLSSQKSGEQQSNPQFGIYAIPNSSDYYVFIGPYDKNEPLGIETVKSFTNIRRTMTTRGVWITTKKIDNVKVIDNPLSFMPSDMQFKVVSLDNEVMQDHPTRKDEEPMNSKPKTDLKITVSKQPLVNDNPKIVKPIKIRKTNGFYQLAPQGYLTHVLPKPVEGPSLVGSNCSSSLLQPILLKSLQSERHPTSMPLLQLPLPSLYYTNSKQNSQTPLKKLNSDDCLPQNSKPVAEIAPQIKIVDVYSEKTDNSQGNTKKAEGSMFILKPEEINKRLMENRITSNPGQTSSNQSNTATDLDQDIENFLKTSSVYIPPNADIFEISDEDEDDTSTSNWKNVWIECESAQIGYIRGRRDVDNLLSFEFPGFKFTEFYPEEEAFSKINQVLSRKIYVPKSIKLKWRVVESISALKRKYELKPSCLGPDFVLTKRGIRHKLAVLVGNKSLLKSEVDNAIEQMSKLEDKSKILEDEGEKLISEMAQMDRDAVLESLVLAKGSDDDAQGHVDREQLSKTLQDITSGFSS